MLRDLIKNVYIMKGQMSNVSKEMKILGKNQKEMLASKTAVTEMKNGL